MKWIISNHKKGLPLEDLPIYLRELETLIHPNIKLVICPCDSQLSYFYSQNYLLGYQNIGNRTIQDLKKQNIDYCIVGHSDDRKKYKETNEVINNKIKKLQKLGICPILCIGEKDKTDTSVKEIIKQELLEGLQDIQLDQLIIAYEPVWAIQSGDIPSQQELEDRIKWIQTVCNEILRINPIILYGGSVNEKTIFTLETIPNLDGYLIGSASLKIEKLKKIIEVIQ